MSFGKEDVDRYTMVYKKDFAPSVDEIEARRNGDEWNAEKAKEYAEKVCLKFVNQIITILIFFFLNYFRDYLPSNMKKACLTQKNPQISLPAQIIRTNTHI